MIPSSSSVPRAVSAFGMLLLLWVAVLFPAACEQQQPPAPAPQRIIEYRDRPLATVAGEIGVPAGVDALGIQVFAEGTSYIALTDSLGRFQLSGLPKGKYVLRALRQDLETIEVDSFEVQEADLTKQQPFLTILPKIMTQKVAAPAGQLAVGYGGLRGRVRSGGAGNAGITVALEGTPWRTTTMAGGVWELVNVTPGAYNVLIEAEGYLPLTQRAEVKSGITSDLPAVDLVSSEAPEDARDRSVVGTVEVLLADGTAATDFSAIRVAVEGTTFSATPDDAGRYQVSGLAPGRYVVSASAPGFLLEAKVEVDVESLATAQADLRLVEDTTGEPQGEGGIAGAVFLQDPPPSGSAGVVVSLPGTTFVASTDRNGLYSFAGVPPGTYDVAASFEGYLPAFVEGVVVEKDRVTEAADLLLEKEVDHPRVVATNPLDGARDVPINQPTRVVIQFSRAMNPRSVQEAITIAPEVGYAFSAQGTDIYVLELDAIPREGGAALRFNRRYTVTVREAATAADGVAMKEDYAFSFTTGQPVIVSTLPADGATSVLFNFDLPMAVYFNAPIDRGSISADDIRFDPPLVLKPTITFKQASKTGWTIMYIRGRAEWDTEYRVTIGRGARTVLGDRVANLPYRFKFRSNKPKEFDEVYGTRQPDYDVRERERARRN